MNSPIPPDSQLAVHFYHDGHLNLNIAQLPYNKFANYNCSLTLNLIVNWSVLTRRVVSTARGHDLWVISYLDRERRVSLLGRCYGKSPQGHSWLPPLSRDRVSRLTIAVRNKAQAGRRLLTGAAVGHSTAHCGAHYPRPWDRPTTLREPSQLDGSGHWEKSATPTIIAASWAILHAIVCLGEVVNWLGFRDFDLRLSTVRWFAPSRSCVLFS